MTGPTYMHSCMSASMSASMHVQSAAVMHECCRRKQSTRMHRTSACTAACLVHACGTRICEVLRSRRHAHSSWLHAMQWCVLQLFRAPRGRIQPLSQMGQAVQCKRAWSKCGTATAAAALVRPPVGSGQGRQRARAVQGQVTGTRGGAGVAGVHPSCAAGAHATTQTLGICT